MNTIPEELKDLPILIVDDNELNVEQLELLLEGAGFTNVRSTRDSREVEKIVPDFNPDLILLDLHMPHKDGYAVLEWLKDETVDGDFLPVLVLTADVTPEAKARAFTLGAMDFLTKPFDHIEVLQRVINQLRARLFHLQLRDQNKMLDSKVRERTKELQNALTELNQAHDHLLAQERMKAMGQMASGIAHDFNNSIAVIMGHAEIYSSFPELLDDRTELLKSIEIIGHAAQDAASIVKRLRQFYRPDGAEDAPSGEGADLAETVKQAIELTKPRWSDQARAEGRQIQIQTQLTPVKVALGVSDVREILTNLIFNAVDAIAGSGSITIRARTNNHAAILEVEDSGTGMSEEVRAKCLETFFTTKGKNGSGLGLGMVQGIVRDNGGDIAIQSAPGEGTTFTIHLPLQSDGEAAEVNNHDNRLGRKLHVLVVDDDEDVRKITCAMLRKDGHTFASAVDGKEGYARFLADYYDLVVTDLAMPHVDGRQLARSIHKRAPEKPILMFTGFGDSMKANGDKPEGVSALLNKPCGLNDLRSALEEIFVKGSPAESLNKTTSNV